MMKQFSTLLLTSLFGMCIWANVPNGYYNNAVGKKDEALMRALEGIIYSHTELSYNDLWTAFDSTDVAADGFYIDMYSNCKYNNQSDHTAGASYVGQGINREHSFPKSWYNSQTPIYTDLHMLIPVDAFVNQRRSNYPYGVCAGGTTYTNGNLTMLGKIGKSTYNGYEQTVFEPDDEYKGDFARIYFYIVTCYKSNVGTWPGCDQLDYAANDYKAFSSWSIQMLLEWHRADPVSQKEIDRNEAVHKEQGNRNPFVDHPELAEYIWGTHQNMSWTGSDTPVDPINKKVPVLLPVDEDMVTGTSFSANWTSGGDVSSYTLNVNRIATGEDEATLLMSESFSNVNANADGYEDISSILDELTDNAGWTGYKLYTAADHSLKVGTSSTAGYLTSPELSLASTVSVKFNAKNWINKSGVSDRSSIVVSCGDVSKTIQLQDSASDFTAVLENCNSRNIKLSATTGGKRFYIYNVEIYNGDLNSQNNAPRRVIVEEGDSTWRHISGITDTCYTVQALAGGLYEYMVKAVYTDGTESAWSNVGHVSLTGEGSIIKGDVNNDGEVNIGDVSAIIDYLLGNASQNFNFDAADMNGDEEINIGDVSAIIDYLLGKS